MGWSKTGTLPTAVITAAEVAALVEGPGAAADAVDDRIDDKADWINVMGHGVTGDGTTDDTVAANAALALVDHTKNRSTVVFPAPGTYMINAVNLSKPDGASRGIDAGLQPKAGTTILIERGATLKVITNNSQGYAAIYLGPDVDDVTIKGPGSIVGDRDTHDFTTVGTHEWGYGVYARGAQNVTVDGVSISKMIGDCVIGSSVGSTDDTDPSYNPSSGRIVNCYLDGARRNNISLIGTDHFLIENNTISRAGYDDGHHDGTAPRAGIDLEFSSTQAVKNTVIRGNKFVGNVTASVECFNSNGVHIDSNFMDSPIIMGAHVLNNCTIVGNLIMNITDTTRSGVALSGGSVGANNILVNSNMVIGWQQGIFLTGFGIVCEGNYVTGFSDSGIVEYLGTDVSIIGNHIADPVVGGTAAGIKFSSAATSPRVEAIGNRISNCYYGMTWVTGATGITCKGNIISKAFTAFYLNAGGAAGVLEGNVTDLPGHSSGTQGSDVVYASTAKVSCLGNTFRNSSAPSIAATSGGSGGTSRIIGNKIVNTTSTIGITCSGGTHEVIGNTLSTAIATGALYAIQISGAAVNCLVMGNIAYHNGASAWTRLVKSDTATGTPATQIMGNTFYGNTVATPHASDVVAGNVFQGTKRVATAASGATLDVNVDQVDMAKRTAQAVNLTVNAPTGTPGLGQELLYRIKDNGTARPITWNAVFTGELPTTTVVGVTHYVLARWNSDTSKYECKNLTPIQGTPDGTKFLRDDGTWATPAGGSSDANPQPSDQGLIGWSFDPVAFAAGTVITAGSMVTVRVPIRAATSITNLLLGISTAGAGLTSGQCFAALYQGGNLLGVTADQSTAWQSTGLKTMALVGGPIAVAAGYVEVCFWANGTTMPAVSRAASGAINFLANAGIAAGNGRFTSANAGLTTTAPSTIGVRSATLAYWAAVS